MQLLNPKNSLKNFPKKQLFFFDIFVINEFIFIFSKESVKLKNIRLVDFSVWEMREILGLSNDFDIKPRILRN